MARYLTPRKASGISAIMISALKITADRMADSGVFRCMMLSAFRTGKVPANMAGMMAKYFATSLAIENVVSAPRVISSCFPICTISMSLVGLEPRSTLLPASLAACVPVFMATPTTACARAGASLVPSLVRAHLALRLFAAVQVHLLFWSGLGEKIVHAQLGWDRGRGERIIAGDHDGL